MTYSPGGALVDHPRTANFVRKFTEGPYKWRYIYGLHNHGGRDYNGRNPVYLLGGVEQDSPERRVIHWGKPVAVLYGKNPKVRISYPDIIGDDGALHISQTQKEVSRVHRVPDALLSKLWDHVAQAEPHGVRSSY